MKKCKRKSLQRLVIQYWYESIYLLSLNYKDINFTNILKLELEYILIQLLRMDL